LAKLILKSPDGKIALLGKDHDFARFEQALRFQLPEEMQRQFISRPAASVPTLVASLRESDCLITVNTSARHLAHALRLPLVALCGSSAEFWLPEGDHVRIVRDTKGVLPPSDQYEHDPLQPSLQRIEVAEVYSAFEELSRQDSGWHFRPTAASRLKSCGRFFHHLQASQIWEACWLGRWVPAFSFFFC